MTEPSTPHDRFFKAVFTHREALIAALCGILPAALVAAIDWDRLEYRPTEHVGAGLSLGRSDLIVRVPLRGRDAFIVFLYEHQSTVDRWMPWGPANNKSAIRPRSRTPGPAYRFGRPSTYRPVRLRRVLQGRSALTHDPTPSVARLIVCRAPIAYWSTPSTSGKSGATRTPTPNTCPRSCPSCSTMASVPGPPTGR